MMVRPWIESIGHAALSIVQSTAVVTASRSHAYFFRNQLLGAVNSLVGVKFLSPPQLRETLLREVRLKLALREHLRLLLPSPPKNSPLEWATTNSPRWWQNRSRAIPIIFSARSTSSGLPAGPSRKSIRPLSAKSLLVLRNRRATAALRTFMRPTAPPSAVPKNPERCLVICFSSVLMLPIGRFGRYCALRLSVPKTQRSF